MHRQQLVGGPAFCASAAAPDEARRARLFVHTVRAVVCGEGEGEGERERIETETEREGGREGGREE